MYLGVKETGSQAKQPTGSAEGGKDENSIGKDKRRKLKNNQR